MTKKICILKDRYKFISSIYEWGCCIASFNLIPRCRTVHFNQLNAGQSVLFVGVGEGQDALEAYFRGLEVTVLESSPAMLKRFRRRLKQNGLENKISIRNEDLFLADNNKKYDIVVSNFFLNVFSKKDLDKILELIKKQLRSGGQLIVSDFAPPKSPFWLSYLQKIYWYCIVTFFYFFAGNAFHKIENYEFLLKEKNLKIIQVRYFGIGAWKIFVSILAQKNLEN